MYKGKTFIISGPSGVGKSTVLKELFKDRDRVPARWTASIIILPTSISSAK